MQLMLQPLVDGEDVALDLVAQLGLQVAQFSLQDSQRWQNDGLWPEGAAGLYVEVKPGQSRITHELHSSLLAAGNKVPSSTF